MDPLEYGRTVVRSELDAVKGLLERINSSFSAAATLIVECRGRTVVTGMGKPGIISKKISATLASTGTPSLSLNPADAYHGDLGRIVEEDVVLILSNSGETSEITRLLSPINLIGAKTIAITGNPDSTLAHHCSILPLERTTSEPTIAMVMESSIIGPAT